MTSSTMYNIFKSETMKGTFDLVNDTVKVILVNGYTPNIDSHTTYADVSSDEASGSGYTAGGATLASKAVTVDNTDDEGVFDAADVSWTTATVTATGAIIYDDTASDYLICYIDFGGEETATAGDFDITWNAEGIVNLG